MDSYDVRVGEDLGDIMLVKIAKRKYWMQDDWYCKYITVKTPLGEHVEFPCFRWLVDDKEVVLRDGRGSSDSVCLSHLSPTPSVSHVVLSLLQRFCLRMIKPVW